MADIIQMDQIKLERIRKGFCQHKHLCYDPQNEHIECKDCGLPVQPFKAFMVMVDNYNSAVAGLKHRHEELIELENRSEKHLLLATRTVDRAWRRKDMLPLCPHCQEAIAPEDGFGGNMVNRKIAMERRKFKQPEEK